MNTLIHEQCEEHASESLAYQFGYRNPDCTQPHILSNFRDPMTLLAAILAEHESMVGDYTMSVKAIKGTSDHYYIIYYGVTITAFCGPADEGEFGYTGFVHVGG